MHFKLKFAFMEWGSVQVTFCVTKDLFISDGNALWMMDFYQKRRFMFSGMSQRHLPKNGVMKDRYISDGYMYLCLWLVFGVNFKQVLCTCNRI